MIAKISRYLVLSITILTVCFLVWFFKHIVMYIMMAWILSLVGQRPMQIFTKIRIGRLRMGPTTAAFLTLATFLSVFLVLAAVFIPLIIEQISNLSDVDSKAMWVSLEEPIEKMTTWMKHRGLLSENATDSPFRDIQQRLYDQFNFAGLPELFSSVIGATGNVLISVFSVIFISFFFLKEQGLFRRLILSFTPIRFEAHVSTILSDIRFLLVRYFIGISLQITVITIFVSVGLYLLGIPNAFLIGFFAALINVIPYIGPMIGATFGVFVTISANIQLDFFTEMVPLLGKVVLVFALMQMLDNFFLQPYIFSNSVQAHPLEIFVMILVGAQLYGIIGMVLAVPVYTILRVFAKVFFSKFKFIQLLTGEVVFTEEEDPEPLVPSEPVQKVWRSKKSRRERGLLKTCKKLNRKVRTQRKKDSDEVEL